MPSGMSALLSFMKSLVDSFAMASRSPESTLLNGSTLVSSDFAFTSAGTRSRQ
jgi:hypothetical protein